MGLSRLSNFISNVKGFTLYVDPNNLDATDGIENKGNSPTRPFITLQRAIIEAVRFSYQRGFDNDRFERTTIMLSPGEHIIDNRPGIIPDWNSPTNPSLDPSYILRSSIRTNDFPPFDVTSNFNISDVNNILYKFNSIHGGVIVPRGISIVGADLRKTKIRPLYIPDPRNDDIERSAIFRITGGSHFWGFTILDSNPNGFCYKDYTTNRFLPNFSHHKLTAFEYVDGVNDIDIQDIFLNFKTDRTDLEVYYQKVGLAYGLPSGRTISPDYPSEAIDIQAKIDEFRIVGSKGQEVGITSIRAGDGELSTSTITVTLQEEVPGLDVDTPIQIQGISVSGYSGQFVVSEVLSNTEVRYGVQNPPVTPLPLSSQIIGATLSIVPDTVTSASPYIFNISLRSVFGMCGLHADGSKANGFKSVVIAQFTGIGLQKDDNAFVLYNPSTGTYGDRTNNPNLYSNSRARFKPSYENYHIKASNNSFIQVVSVFAIGYANHFLCESGGDMSITNSNSNFGAKSLISKGFRDTSFLSDDIGYITHIIPPKEIEDEEVSIEFKSIDIETTQNVGFSNRLYLLNEVNAGIPLENVLEGYRIGAKSDEKLSVFVNGQQYSSRIVMDGADEITSKKIYNVAKKVNGISNEINSNVITLTENHDFINGETVRIFSDNGHLPDGVVNNQIYYVITNTVDANLGTNQIKLAQSLNDAINGDLLESELVIFSNESGNLTIVSSVSDKNSGDIGHPIQWDNNAEQWYILVESSNDIYNQILGSSLNATQRTFITRIPDTRNTLDTVYRLRYVIPKDSPTTARPPLDGFIIQESGDVIGPNSEIQKYFSLGFNTLENSTEIRNFKFIANATWNNGVSSITTELPHNLSAGSEIEIKNIISTENLDAKDNIGYNGRFIVANIISRKSFTIELATNPGVFDIRQTINRGQSLPYFRRVRFPGTYIVYRSQEVQPYIKNEQDGVYHLLITDSSYSPSVTPFNELNFSQPIQNLYPQINRDNLVSDPHRSTSFAVSDTIGKVVVDNPENSLTKESLTRGFNDLNIGIGVTNIISDSVGVSHTIYTSTDHGLNRVTRLEIVTPGFGYGTGSPGNIYNARLVGLAGSVTGDGATAVISVDSSGIIGNIRVLDGGSAYGIGNSLSVVGTATTTGHIPAIVRVASIYNDTDEILSLNETKEDEFNTLYRITNVQVGKSKEIEVQSVSPISVASTTGLSPSDTQFSYAIPRGKALLVSSLSYNPTSGVGIVTTTSSHGLQLDNKIRIGGADEEFYNGNFIIKRIRNLTSFEVDFGVSNTNPPTTGQIYVFRNGLTSNGGNVTRNNENISGRLIPQYAGITTTLSFGISNPNEDSIFISNALNIGLNLGDYLQINDEILRIKQSITGNQIFVYRGLLGTRRRTHLNGSVVRRISPKPIEFRRNSIIRASGHTFEYVGFGPGNYSTALPERQDRILSVSESLLSQSTKIDGGINVFTGMNDSGDFYIGNKKVSSSTGQEEVFDAPIPSVTGEEIDIGGLNVGFDVLTPLEVAITRSIRVEGGADNNIISKFNGPVIFNNKITSNSSSGIQVKSLYLQGESEISRRQTVGFSTPTTAGNPGDIVYNGNPTSGGDVGWVYTTGDVWERFGTIAQNNILDNSLIISTYDNELGLTTGINFVGAGGIDILSFYDNGYTTLIFDAQFDAPETIVVSGISTFNSTVIFDEGITISGISTFNNLLQVNNDINVSGTINANDIIVTGIASFNSLSANEFTSGTSSFSGDIIVGSTSRAENSFVRVLSGDNNNAGFEAYGNTEGTGYLYLGQSSSFGGGLFYNGNGNPAFASGETPDTIAFYRKFNNTNSVVFSYPVDANDVTFVGSVTASNFITPGALNINGNLNVSGVVTCTDLNSTSDIKLKKDISPVNNSIELLNQLNGVEFTWKDSGKKSIGVIAQELENILPQLVSDTGENKTVNYNGLIGVLIEAVKSQQTQINSLEEKLKKLEDR